MNLAETIRSSTSVHDNLLVALDPEIVKENDFYETFLNWIEHNQDGLVALHFIKYSRKLLTIIHVLGFMCAILTTSYKLLTSLWNTWGLMVAVL